MSPKTRLYWIGRETTSQLNAARPDSSDGERLVDKREGTALSLRGFVILLVVFLGLFVLYGLLAWLAFERDWSKSGVFGDTFGGLNAIFSGTALVGVIVSILLQREELRLQGEELRMTRGELRRTAEAQEKAERALQEQAEAMRLTARLNSINTLIGIYREAVSTARGVSGAYIATRREEQRLQELTEELESLIAKNQAHT